MGVLSSLSFLRPRVHPEFAQSEDATMNGAISGFDDPADLFSAPSRRESDAQQLRGKQPDRKRWMVALLLIAAYIMAAIIFASLESLAWDSLAIFGAVVASFLVVFIVLIRLKLFPSGSGKNLKTAIAAVFLALMLLLVYLEPASQILLAPFTFVAMAYGMYRIPRAYSAWLALLMMCGYAFIIALHYIAEENPSLLRLEIMHFAALSLSLPSFVYLSGKAFVLNRILNTAGKRIRTIEADAERDALLGCYNRRYIVQALEEQKQVADDLNSPLCIAIIDLDHFKRVNDEMGHLGGDEVLRVFSRVAQQSVRDLDIFGRYGGEEFLLIFPGTSLLPALNTCERLRSQVESHVWPSAMLCKVTISIGVTEYVRGESVLEFFSRADTATYLAKEGGRNQVVVEEPVEYCANLTETPPNTLQDEEEDDQALMLAEEAGLVDLRR